MLQFGFNTALGEITLVLFTTLAPPAVLACMIMAGVIASRPLAFEARSRISHAIAIPLVVSMVGLVASATHLGNPSNALYVFLGVGRSPLSNEVFAAVIFLAVCGLYWLFSFSEKDRPRVHRVWCALIVAAGAVCIAAISLAYNVGTIITWHTAHVPTNVVLSALAGGPVLGMLGLRIARAVCMHTRLSKVLAAVAVVALALNIACLVSQNALMPNVTHGYGPASGLVPFYGEMICAYVLIAGVGVLSVAVPLWRGKLPPAWRFALAGVLFYAGLFIVRFGFYMMHMTVGLGV